MIIADENLEQYWIELLEAQGYVVYSIRKNQPGLADTGIIEFVKEKSGILLTEDKDFGELVFAYGFRNTSIIFIRYDQPQYEKIEKQLLRAIELYRDSDIPVFVTVTEKKVRVNKL